MTKAKKIGVTMRSVIQRLNRKLAAKGEVVKVARGERMRQELGDYYIIDFRMNGVITRMFTPKQWLAKWAH